MKIFNKLNIKRIIIILGIVIIPLMYSYFYLSAFWDPYSKLEDLPVAIVNKDEGTIIDEKERNIGNELKEKMQKSESLNFCFVSKEEADSGITDGKYYAVIVIPNDFSKNITSVNSEEKTSAKLIYSPNEKTNYLASQILSKAILQITDGVKENVVGEVVGELSGKLQEVPSELTKINDGVSKLSDGASQVNTGATTLKNGINTLNTNYSTFNLAFTNLSNGATKLNDGSKNLDSGISKVYEGSKTLESSTKNLSKINDSAKALNVGTNTLNVSTNAYVTGVNAYIAQSNEIGARIGAYVTANPSAMADSNIQYIMGVITNPNASVQVNALKNGGQSLVSGTKTLNDNMTLLANGTTDLYKINEGVNSLTSGLEQVKNGSSSLVNGTEELKTGVNKISVASNSVLTGINKLSNGATELNNGTTKVEEGLKTANSEITNGISTTNEQLTKLNGVTEFTKEPVKVEQETISSVPNYGTAFSSYFMSLSLWVGGLIIFVGIYLDADEKFKILSRHSTRKVLRTFIYLIIGVVQALLLAIVLRTALKLEVVNIPLYYLSCVLVSVVFISIIQFLMINFKDVGKFAVIVLLILQLTSCGGTFPMQLVPKFFNILYPFMPMTYSVNLFKEVISGGDMGVIIQNTIILSVMLISFVAFTIIGSKIRSKKQENKISVA